MPPGVEWSRPHPLCLCCENAGRVLQCRSRVRWVGSDWLGHDYPATRRPGDIPSCPAASLSAALSANARTTCTHAVAPYHRKLTAPCYSSSPRWTERGRFPCCFLHSGGQRPNSLAALFACAGMFELERHHGLGELRRLLTTHPHPAARDAARCWCYRGLPRAGLVPGRGGTISLNSAAYLAAGPFSLPVLGLFQKRQPLPARRVPRPPCDYFQVVARLVGGPTRGCPQASPFKPTRAAKNSSG